MAAPVITVEKNDTGTTVASWDAGTVQANNDSDIFTIVIWNNKGNTTSAVSDLKDASITTLDMDGGTSSDVVAGKWVQINVPAIDGTDTTVATNWSAIGGATMKYIRADGLPASAGSVIRGTTNDGNSEISLTSHVEI